MKNYSTQRKELKELLSINGIGIITASSIIAETGNILRFKNKNALASYSGFGRREYKSGSNNTMGFSLHYNHFLKDAFMTMVIQYIKNNPKSKMADYHKKILEQGHSGFYARRKTGRAMIRRIFKILNGAVLDQL